VFNLVTGEVLRATDETPLIIPEGAVVVPGSRAISKGKGHPNSDAWGLSLSAAVIVKYRDDKTSLSTTLEDLLRQGGF
jgi:2,3,4,5-tetrahydropyridine-2-carboxylate N-succinyltransferase